MTYAERIESIARAIGDADNAISATGAVENYRRILARAADAACLAALAEPTEEMARAGDLDLPIETEMFYEVPLGEYEAKKVWRAMLAAIPRG